MSLRDNYFVKCNNIFLHTMLFRNKTLMCVAYCIKRDYARVWIPEAILGDNAYSYTQVRETLVTKQLLR